MAPTLWFHVPMGVQVEKSLEETANMMINDRVDIVAENSYAAAKDRLHESVGDEVTKQVRWHAVASRWSCRTTSHCACVLVWLSACTDCSA